jgi:hypothetical protein
MVRLPNFLFTAPQAWAEESVKMIVGFLVFTLAEFCMCLRTPPPRLVRSTGTFLRGYTIESHRGLCTSRRVESYTTKNICREVDVQTSKRHRAQCFPDVAVRQTLVHCSPNVRDISCVFVSQLQSLFLAVDVYAEGDFLTRPTHSAPRGQFGMPPGDLLRRTNYRCM